MSDAVALLVTCVACWASGLALGVVVTNHYANGRWQRLYRLMLDWKRDAIGWHAAAKGYARAALEWKRQADIHRQGRDDEGESWKRGVPPV